MKKLLIFGIIALTCASAFAYDCPRCKKSSSYLYNCDKCHTTVCRQCGGSTEKEIRNGSFYGGSKGDTCPVCKKGKLQEIR